MLKLEISWIQKEENNPDKLSDEKLKIYNETLKEQVTKLNAELCMLAEHRRYQPLQKYAFSPYMLKNLNVEEEKLEAKNLIKELAESIRVLKLEEKEALAEVKAILKAQIDYNRKQAHFKSFFD